ncbi:MAG: TMEM175 family protein [Pseudomonadota bacterium]
MTESSFPRRGAQMTRLETFADAAFAFSAALLAISIDEVPSNYPELLVAVQGAPAFATSLLVLMFFWHGHQRWSDRYGLEDSPSVYLTFALIMMVMIYVYPLKILMQSGFSYVTNGWLPSGFNFQSYYQFRVLVTMYAIGFVMLCMVMAGLYFHAWRQRKPLEMCAREAFDTLSEAGRWLFPAAFSMIAIIFLWILRDEAVVYVPFSFLLLALFSPINDRIVRGMARRRFGAQDSP